MVVVEANGASAGSLADSLTKASRRSRPRQQHKLSCMLTLQAHLKANVERVFAAQLVS